MPRRLPFLVVLVALVIPLALAGQPPVARASDESPVRPFTAISADEPLLYIVMLDGPALASYRGGTRNLPATSPEVTGARHVDVNSPASQAYLAYLAEKRDDLLRRAQERLGRALETGYIYDVVLNGFTTRLTPSEAAAVAELRGVRSVQPNEVRQLLTDRGPGWIGAPSAWGAPNACAPGGNCGEGMIIGVVDTGLNFDHPSFSDTPADGYVYANPFGPGVYKGWCNTGFPVKVTCNNKVVGAWSYANSDNNPEDLEGHGSHTASTAGGNRIAGANFVAPTITIPFDISGVAPHANIIVYDACTTSGCNNTDLVAALQQAVTDGVDAVNYSISGSGESPWVAADEQAFLDLRNSGAFVSASAGNSGPGPSTVAHGSPWVVTTAASTHDRALINAVIGLNSANGALPDIYGRSVTSALGSTPMVYAGNIKSNPLCLSGVWNATDLAGKLVVCDRGNNARIEKAENVKAAGGLGIVLANAAANGDELIADGYAIPGVHVTYKDGVTLKNWLAASQNPVGAIKGTIKDIANLNGDVMAAFSSRGPNEQVRSIIKPDMTAPGVDIMAAWASNVGFAPPEYDIISGTSMSSPHMTGAGALMMKARPTWSIAEIQSALMTTSYYGNTLREDDGVSPTDPFDRGSGRVNITAALNAGLLLNITGAQYDAADPALGGDPKTLNYPSLGNDACYKSCGWTRTVRNPTGQAMTWDGSFIGQNGLAGSLTVPSFTINAGATQQWGLDIPDTTNLTPGKWYFGVVVYTERNNLAPDAHFPVAIQVAGSQAPAIVGKVVNPTGAAQGASLSYTVIISNTVGSSRSFSVEDIVPAGATYVAKTGDWTYAAGKLSWSGSLGAATPTTEERVLSGYQSLGAEGIPSFSAPPNLINGINVSGVNIKYFGTTYPNVFMCKDGLLIPVATSSTIANCGNGTNVQLPATAAPNNAMAPWWTGLTFDAQSKWYAAGVLYNGKPHSVFEWEKLKVTGSNPEVRLTFQIWMEDGGDNMWFAYAPGFNPGANPKGTVGFENSDGTVGATYYYKGSSGSAVGKVPDGTKDIWFGLKPASKQFGYTATASGAVDSTVVNEASATVASATYKAWASTRLCGVATATQPTLAIQAAQYTLSQWPGKPWNSFEYYRSTAPYVAAGGAGSTLMYSGRDMTFVDKAAPVVGNPAVNYFYVLRTKNCAGTSSADSGWVGVFGFALTKGN